MHIAHAHAHYTLSHTNCLGQISGQFLLFELDFSQQVTNILYNLMFMYADREKIIKLFETNVL